MSAAIHLMETARTLTKEKQNDSLCVKITKKKFLCIVLFVSMVLLVSDIAVTAADLLKKTSVNNELVTVANATVNLTQEMKHLIDRFVDDYSPEVITSAAVEHTNDEELNEELGEWKVGDPKLYKALNGRELATVRNRTKV